MTSNSWRVSGTSSPVTRTIRPSKSIAASAHVTTRRGASARTRRRDRTRANSSSMKNGFATKSTAPSSKHASRSASSVRAVSTMTGADHRPLSCASTANPVCPGRSRSRTTWSGRLESARRRPFVAAGHELHLEAPLTDDARRHGRVVFDDEDARRSIAHGANLAGGFGSDARGPEICCASAPARHLRQLARGTISRGRATHRGRGLARRRPLASARGVALLDGGTPPPPSRRSTNAQSSSRAGISLGASRRRCTRPT